jgi:ABC-type bacteriocin/lantibiotic exporter with double-glycine peptidase domain
MTARSRLRIRSAAIWLLAAAAVAAGALAPAAPGGEAPFGDANRVCGPNSLYVLLRLSGVALSYRDLARYYPSDPRGMSLLELRQACADFGLAADVRHCTQADLRVLSFPVIAHVHYGPQRAGDHYAVISRRLDNDRIEAIDGTTGKVHEFLIPKMDNIWEGDLLVPRRAQDHRIIVICLLALVVQLIGFVALLRWLPARSPLSPRA